jgi:uncharacterized glyoxalase superfamily protein PhnB
MTDTQTGVSPYLYYVDGIAAMEFLANAFGFREHTRMVEDDGTLRHGEMRLGDAAVMLGCPPGIRTPKEIGQVTVGVYIRVPDVDAHYARAVAAGAEVDGPPQDQPYRERLYAAVDPEGHQWWFATPLA